MDWKNKPSLIFNKIKLQMYTKGIQNFFYVDQFIQTYDPELTGRLSQHTFNTFTNKIGIFFTLQQIRSIKDIYCKQSGLINYRQLFEDVKYSISQRVAAHIASAYDKLDPNHTENIPLQHAIDSYDPSQHPLVISRRKSPEAARAQFVQGISRKAKDGRLSRQQFVDYYAELNFCLPAEQEKLLLQLLVGTWGLAQSEDYVSQERLRQIEHVVYEKVREKSDGRTSEWKCAKMTMSYFDLGDVGSCDFGSFVRALDKFGCNFKRNQMKALFDKYDLDKSGKLDYEQFSKMLMAIDINGLQSKPSLLKTLGTNYFKVTH